MNNDIDIDTMLWEIFDYLKDELLHDKNVVATYCAEEFPPTLSITTTSNSKFDLPIEMLTDDYNVLDKYQLMYSKIDDNELAEVLNSVRICIRKWKYANNVKSINDNEFGPSIYFENDYGMKFSIGITRMPML